MAWQLVPDADDRPAVPIDRAIIFFGRHPECDVVITTSRKVSRKHCCVAQVNDTLVVRDLGSMNGVRVNGRQVRRQAPLRLGDVLTVGDVVFRVVDVPAKRKFDPQKRTAELSNASPARRDLSRDVPVVIPEEESSFSVEESVRRRAVKRPANSEPIELSRSDIIDDDDDSWVEVPSQE